VGTNRSKWLGNQIGEKSLKWRVIEALRIYAAAHNGILPEALNPLTEVPVPDDPATGEPFIYRADDGAAILHGLRAGLPLQPTYRIMVRHQDIRRPLGPRDHTTSDSSLDDGKSQE
jgi:hypothetical protein